MKQSISFPVILDKTIEELIHLGHYDMTNSLISEQLFSYEISSGSELNAWLVDFDKFSSIRSAIVGIELMGFRAANLRELLSFGIHHPTLQLQYEIIALGELPNWHYNHKAVPYLDSWNQKRKLSLDCWVNKWPPGCHFLTIQQ